MTGARPGPEGSIGRLMVSEHQQNVFAFVMNLLGAEGMLISDYEMRRPDVIGETALGSDDKVDLQKGFLTTRGSTIGGGTTEISRNILGERVLGLPEGTRRRPRPPVESAHAELMGSSENGVSRGGPGSLGSPSTRSPMMLRWISSEPPAIRTDGAARNPVTQELGAAVADGPSSASARSDVDRRRSAMASLAIDASGPGSAPRENADTMRRPT